MVMKGLPISISNDADAHNHIQIINGSGSGHPLKFVWLSFAVCHSFVGQAKQAKHADDFNICNSLFNFCVFDNFLSYA